MEGCWGREQEKKRIQLVDNLLDEKNHTDQKKQQQTGAFGEK